MYLKKRHIFSVALFVFVKERNDNVRNCKEMGVKQALGAETCLLYTSDAADE